MTRVTSHTEVRTRHVWTVPAEWGHPAVIQEIDLARHWAEKRAQELGISTSCDDWLYAEPSDDSIVLWFETTKKEDSG